MLNTPAGSSANMPVRSIPYPFLTFAANSLFGCEMTTSPPKEKRDGKVEMADCASTVVAKPTDVISTHTALDRIVSPLGLELCVGTDSARSLRERYISLR